MWPMQLYCKKTWWFMYKNSKIIVMIIKSLCALVLSCNLATICSEAPRVGQQVSYQYRLESKLHTTNGSSIMHQRVGNPVVGVYTLSKQKTESFFELLVPFKVIGHLPEGFPEYAVSENALFSWTNDTRSPDYAHLEKIFPKARELLHDARHGLRGNFHYSFSLLTLTNRIDFNEQDLPN